MDQKSAKTFILILSVLFVSFLSSCGKSEFIHEMQGKWKVTEMNYIFDDTTFTQMPSNMFFQFSNYSYSSLIGDSVAETGTYNVNAKVTQITFTSSLGHEVMNIEEKSQTYQHWKSKNKLGEFYLDFKLDKIE